MNRMHRGLGVLVAALAVALAGCETMPESGQASTGASTQTEQPAAAAAAAEKTDAPATPPAGDAEPMGVAAMAGHWAGTWNGAGKSTLTVSGDSADTMAVEYCYDGDCSNIAGATFDDGKLRWSNEGWHFEFELKGEKVRGKLRNPRGTIRISMKRM